MRIKLRFYSAHREIIGSKEMEIEVEEDSTVRDVMNYLIEKYPDLKKLEEMTIFSLNHRYAKGDEKLKDGDEIAMFLPLEGG